MGQPCQAILTKLAVLMCSICYQDAVISKVYPCVDTPGSACKIRKQRGECITNYLGMLGDCCATCCEGPTITPNCCEPACNHGTCIKLQDTIKCNCAGSGYHGTVCDLDLCSGKSPCIHGGRCINHYNGTLSCNCTGTGYSGEHCSKDECTTKRPCIHGKCINHGNGTLSCDCTGSGYTGQTCDIDVDECVGQQDLCGEKKCVNIPGTFKCEAESSSFVDSFPGKAVGLGLAIAAITISSVGAAVMIGHVFRTMIGRRAGQFQSKSPKNRQDDFQDIDADEMKEQHFLSKKSSSSSSPSPLSPRSTTKDKDSNIDIENEEVAKPE